MLRLLIILLSAKGYLGMKCYDLNLKGYSESEISVKTYEIKGFITRAKISNHFQYKVTKEQRLCKPTGEEQCYDSEIRAIELRDEKEMAEAIGKGKCLVGRECKEGECHEQRAYLCENDIRDRWIYPNKRNTLKLYDNLFFWVCQIAWECELREFNSNVQILSVDPFQYRLETPQGGFVECLKEGRSVQDSLGYYINCPKVDTETVETIFHCIQHPERTLCRDSSDHALLDFTKNTTNALYNNLYHIKEDSRKIIESNINKLGSGTITDMEKLMKEIEMDNLQTILDLTIMKRKINSLSNLVLEILKKDITDDPLLVGKVIGDNFITEGISNRVAKQCEDRGATPCKCWRRYKDKMKCARDLSCESLFVSNNTLKILDAFSEYNMEMTLVQDIQFKNKISDMWIDDLRVEASRRGSSSDNYEKEKETHWFQGLISIVYNWIISNLLETVSFILAVYSLKLHLTKNIIVTKN